MLEEEKARCWNEGWRGSVTGTAGEVPTRRCSPLIKLCVKQGGAIREVIPGSFDVTSCLFQPVSALQHGPVATTTELALGLESGRSSELCTVDSGAGERKRALIDKQSCLPQALLGSDRDKTAVCCACH